MEAMHRLLGLTVRWLSAKDAKIHFRNSSAHSTARSQPLSYEGESHREESIFTVGPSDADTEYWRWEAAVQNFTDSQARQWAKFLKSKGISVSSSTPNLTQHPASEPGHQKDSLILPSLPAPGFGDALASVFRWTSIQGLDELWWKVVTVSIFLTPIALCAGLASSFPSLVRPALYSWALAEAMFYIVRFLEWRRVSNDVVAQEVPSKEEVSQLLNRILSLRRLGVVQPQEFFSGWFLGAPFSSLSRDKLKEFLAFGLYHRDLAELTPELQAAVEENMVTIEQDWGVTTGSLSQSIKETSSIRRSSTLADVLSAAQAAGLEKVPRSFVTAVREVVRGAEGERQKEQVQFMRHTREPLRALLHPLAFYVCGHIVGLLTRLSLLAMGFQRKKCQSTGLRYYILRRSTGVSSADHQAQETTEPSIALGTVTRNQSLGSAEGFVPLGPATSDQLHESEGGTSGRCLQAENALEEEACVFVHGLGIGLTPYLGFISMLRRATEHRHKALAMLELPHLAFRLGAGVPSVNELVKGLDEVVSDCCLGPQGGVSLLGHSYGSLVLAQYVRTRPSKVSSLGLIDPVCILLCLPFTIYNFVYKVPDFETVKGTVSDTIRLLMCSRELNVARTLCRNFNWHDLHLWAHQMPERTVVMLAGQDRIVPAQRIRKYLEAHQIPVLYHERLSHAQYLFRPETQRLFLQSLYGKP